MNFATNLRRLRIDAGLTQEQLAHACGFSGQSRIGNYESMLPGARQPKPDELPRIAAALGVGVAELLGETAPSRQSHAVQLDPEIVEATHKAMTDMYNGKHWKYPAGDVARFLLVYEKLALRKSGVSDAELFGAGTVEGVTPQGVVSERVVGVPGKGVDAGTVAGRVRRQAKSVPSGRK